jgi:hypothetical protein
MRRTGVILTSIATALLGMPTLADASGAAVAATGCVATALPVPTGATGGGSVTAILEPGTYLGAAGADFNQGLIWRNGVNSPLAIVPSSVNASGLMVGTSGGNGRSARMQLGGTPQYGGYYTYFDEINSEGDAVGGIVFVDLATVRKAVWWRPGNALATELPGPVYASAMGIDDLGYKVGHGQDSTGLRRELVWDANGQITRQFGPYSDNEVQLYLTDIDNGVALATRYHPNGTKDIALVDVRTGAVTPLANTNGVRADIYEEGWVAGEADDLITPVLWHNGAQVSLPALPNTRPSWIQDVKVFGSTAIVAGYSVPLPGSGSWYRTPTIWRCS